MWLPNHSKWQLGVMEMPSVFIDGIFVSHPIQDRNIEEMKELAETFFESILGLICKKSN